MTTNVTAPDGFYYPAKGRLLLRVKATPGAKQNSITGVKNQELLVRIKAQAERGKANKELLKYLAGLLEVPRSQLTISSGESSRHKLISIPQGLETVLDKLKR